jgi:uncharacterized protein YuzE
MATPLNIDPFLQLIPRLKEAPSATLWVSYDEGADTLYVSFGSPRPATDGELTEDDIILRYEGSEIIGFTVLHASQRAGIAGTPANTTPA